MRRSVSVLLMTAVATVSVSCTSTNSSPSTPPAATPTPYASSDKPAASGTFTGPAEYMQWGPVQVTITVRDKRLTDVQASAPTERARSAFINEQAVPLLRQEALQAQGATIDLISGATLTSEAFAASLRAALGQAHL